MIITSGIATAAMSGSVGGTTASHNKGGQYFRQRSIPTNPSSVDQQTVRNIMGTLSSEWGAQSSADRAAWEAWATQNPIINALGASILMSGHQSFISLNARLLRDGTALVATPPIGSRPDGFLTAVQDGDIGTGDTDLTFTPALTSGNKVMLYGTVTNSAGITYVKNRLVLIATSAIDEASPWDNEADIVAKLGTLVVGQTLHIEAAQFNPVTGQQSTFLRSSTVIVSTP